MNLFVTGATGFIGSHFVEQAIQAGHTVVGLRRTEVSKPRITLSSEPTWLTKSMAELTADDFQSIDCLVHLAAHTPNVPYDTLENCLFWNLTVPLNMMRAAHQGSVDRFVVAGSCFEYGPVGDRYEFIPSDAPLEATISYPASKAAASIVFRAFAKETRARLSIHRIFQVFGEGEAENRLWPSLRCAALSGEDFRMTAGEQVRDFIPVEDVAKHLLEACGDSSIIRGVAKISNVGTGKPQTIRQFAEYWWKHWNAAGKLRFGDIPYRDGEVMRYVGNVIERTG